MKQILLLLLVLSSCFTPVRAEPSSRQLLELVDVLGVRDNQLVGYGLVVGLAGSGDKAQVKFSAQSLNNMLKQFGVTMDESRLPKSKNIAAVAVPERGLAGGYTVGRIEKILDTWGEMMWPLSLRMGRPLK